MSGVPQGTVLGPTLFLIYINDIFNHIDNDMHLFADDAKLFGIAYPQSNQHNIVKLQVWTHDWLLQFNAGKCCVLHLGPNNPMTNYTIYNPTTKVREQLKNRAEERDLGVIIHDKLKFQSHVQHVVSCASSSLGLLKQTINSRQASIFIKLYKALVRPHLNFAMCLAGPSYQQNVRLIENVQKRASKCIKSLESTSYEDCLKLPTLVYQRLRRDMILTYKLQNEKSAIFGGDPSTSQHNTRGHSKKLPKSSSQSKNLPNILFEKSHKSLELTQRFNCQCSLHPVLQKPTWQRVGEEAVEVQLAVIIFKSTTGLEDLKALRQIKVLKV